MASKAGGGINSRQHRSVGVRTGKPTRGVNVRAASQIGSSMGNKATEHSKLLNGAVEKMDQGVKRPGATVPLGNEVALNVKGVKNGSGAGRTLYGQCGSQGVHGNNGKTEY